MRSPTADALIQNIKQRKTPYMLKIGGLTLRIEKDVYPSSGLNEFMAKIAFCGYESTPQAFSLLSPQCVLEPG